MKILDRLVQVSAFLLLGVCALPAMAKNTQDEFWPEFDLYLQQGENMRLESVDTFNQGLNGGPYLQGRFSYFLDLALRPLLRRELRWKNDVFRQKYLTFRAGYQYKTSLLNGDSSSEHRGIVEFTSRYGLPGGIFLSDRNRGEFRFIHGQPFSERYRNRLRAERDFSIGRFSLTPYVYDEVFYDSRYHAWTINRYAAGILLPAGPHLVVEPFIFRQNQGRTTPPHVNVLGLTFNLYF